MRKQKLSLKLQEFSEEEEIVAELNITPLTDIFLVLLVIFMVSSSIASQSGVNLQLPKVSAGMATAQENGVVVSLLSQSVILIDGKKILFSKKDQHSNFLKQRQEFQKLLRARLSQVPSGLVILEGDREVFLGVAVEIMDLAKQAGAQKFAIATVTNPVQSDQKKKD